MGLLPPAIGVKWLGWTLAVLGFAEMFGSLVFGKLADIIGKRPVMIATFIIQAAAILCSFFLHDIPPYMFFITMFVAGLAGLLFCSL
jgi:predicted MFS family arabinose efflux permease